MAATTHVAPPAAGKQSAPPKLSGPGKTGTVVLYQPEAQEWPNGHYQHAAIITGWDEDTEKANLLVFPDSVTYTLSKNQVVEGTVDGTFQQFGAQSDTQKALEEQKQAARDAQKAAAPPASDQPAASSQADQPATHSSHKKGW